MPDVLNINASMAQKDCRSSHHFASVNPRDA
jgi:hypothetical protein